MKKAIIELEGDSVIFDGVRVSLDVIPQVLYEMAHPDPRKWYRLERVNDTLLVHVFFHDPIQTLPPMEVSNGNYVRERGRSGEEDAGSEGTKATHPHDEHSPNR